MEHKIQEIAITLDRLLNNLGLELEEFDLSVLTQAELYMEIYKTMFPILTPHIMKIDAKEDMENGEKIQFLIDVLAGDILKMDLSHISGKS